VKGDRRESWTVALFHLGYSSNELSRTVCRQARALRSLIALEVDMVSLKDSMDSLKDSSAMQSMRSIADTVTSQFHSGPGQLGEDERAVSVAAGSILAVLGLYRRTFPGLLGAAAGGVLIWMGVTGHCPFSPEGTVGRALEEHH
jgi:hypothetical protein